MTIQERLERVFDLRGTPANTRSAGFAHRDRSFRSIVIGRSAHRDRRFGHQDRSEATRELFMPSPSWWSVPPSGVRGP